MQWADIATKMMIARQICCATATRKRAENIQLIIMMQVTVAMATFNVERGKAIVMPTTSVREISYAQKDTTFLMM